jgi:hypothetical protein
MQQAVQHLCSRTWCCVLLPTCSCMDVPAHAAGLELHEVPLEHLRPGPIYVAQGGASSWMPRLPCTDAWAVRQHLVRHWSRGGAQLWCVCIKRPACIHWAWIEGCTVHVQHHCTPPAAPVLSHGR